MYVYFFSVSMLLSHPDTNFVEAKGSISFRRVRRYGCGHQWHRECTLQLAYSLPPFTADLIACQFSVIIYSDEMKCRRNLAKVFDKMKFMEET